MATFHTVKDAVKLFDAGFSGGKTLNTRQEQVLILYIYVSFFICNIFCFLVVIAGSVGGGNKYLSLEQRG